jgi:cytochrome P450
MLTVFRQPFMDPHKKWWKELRETVGSVPFMSYSSLLGAWTVMVLDPDLVKFILTEPVSKETLRFPKKYVFIKEIIGEGLVTLEGSAWSRHRRIIQPAFNTNVLKEALNRSVPELTETLISSWRSTQGFTIDVASHMSALTLDVIGEVAFSHDFGALQVLQDWATTASAEGEDEQLELAPISDPLIQAFQESLKISGLVIILGILNLTWIEKYLNPKSGRTRKLLNEAVDNVIRDARAKETSEPNGDSTKKKSLLQVLFQAKDTQDGQDKNTLSDVELRDETKTFIVAGHETTSTWCYWAMYALAKFPDVQEKLYEEIAKHASADTTFPVTLEQVDTMPYLSAFLSEVLRLYSPVGMIIRFTSQPEHWKGYTIPAKTRLVIPIHLLHRHPDYWSRPDDFWPERWLNDKEAAARHRFCFLPFSAGGRNCVGQRFAEYEAKLIVANICRAFTIQLAPSMRDEEISFTNFVSMKSNPRIQIRVKER